MHMGGPVDAESRIGELDVIRGFALFGVLWMNLYEHADFIFPEAKLIPVVPHAVDATVGFVSRWLMLGKAQALFSLLFGFGFALFLSRADAAGRDGTRLYLRRAGFLLVLGIAHALLLWAGDILQAYAMMAFLLVFTRRWPGWLLLAVGVPLALLTTLVDRLVWEHAIAGPGVPLPYMALMETGAARRMPVFLSHDYVAYVRELWRALTVELYGTSTGFAYLGWVLGRFLIGSWLFRQGWIQNARTYAAGFRRWSAILLLAGLAMALVGPVLAALHVKPTAEWQKIALTLLGRSQQLVLALGYAAGLVVLCQHGGWARRLGGLAAAGRMALTNYLTQSLLYVFLLYGFGAGLLLYTSPAMSLALALLFFLGQIAFSRWWLARYRFGPAEWLWRSWTYGHRPAMRRPDSAMTPVTA